MAPQFPVNTHRLNPYPNMKFLLFFEGKPSPVAGVSKISALKRSTEVITHTDGGNPNNAYLAPSRWKFEPITVERGITHDPDFEAWANLVYSADGDSAISLKFFRRNLRIVLLNEAGEEAKAYNVYRCWVSEYQALPELDANGNAVAIEHMVIQNEGWERDTSVPEPTET
jgi:phage tail-like protein